MSFRIFKYHLWQLECSDWDRGHYLPTNECFQLLYVHMYVACFTLWLKCSPWLKLKVKFDYSLKLKYHP